MFVVFSGTITRFGECSSQFQHAYVGNMAWAHVLAAETMTRDPESVGGQTFFLTDDTPLLNIFELMKPYLKQHGMGVSERKARYWVVYSLVYLAEIVCVLLRPIVKLNMPIETCRVTYLNKTYSFNGDKAKKMFGYSPIYSYAEAKQRSMDYYKTIDIDSL